MRRILHWWTTKPAIDRVLIVIGTLALGAELWLAYVWALIFGWL